MTNNHTQGTVVQTATQSEYWKIEKNNDSTDWNAKLVFLFSFRGLSLK